MNRLYRSPDDRVFAGVAGGMAEAWDLDPALVRVGWAFLILVTGGLFLLLYVVMAVVVPLRSGEPVLWDSGSTTDSQPEATPGQPTSGPPSATSPIGAPYGTWQPGLYRRPRHRRDGTGGLVIGLFLIVIGAYFLLREYVPTLNFDLIWPLIVIGGGVLLVVAAFGRTSQRA